MTSGFPHQFFNVLTGELLDGTQTYRATPTARFGFLGSSSPSCRVTLPFSPKHLMGRVARVKRIREELARGLLNTPRARASVLFPYGKVLSLSSETVASRRPQ